MAGNYSKLITVTTGQLITAAERNNEFDNVINNMTPTGLDDASADITAMQATADPYPGAVASLPTSGLGELQRMRYQLVQFSGNTYWYQDIVIYHDRGDPAAVDFAVGALTISAAFVDLDLSAVVPAGTVAVHLHVQATNGLAGQSVTFRKNGNSNSINIAKVVCQVAAVQTAMDIVVPCDTSRIIEYLATNGNTFSVLNITVKGYWR